MESDITPYQSQLKMECSKAEEWDQGRGKGKVLKAAGLVREALVEDMVLTTSGAAALLDPLDRQAWEGMYIVT